jgi:hypothetical protein
MEPLMPMPNPRRIQCPSRRACPHGPMIGLQCRNCCVRAVRTSASETSAFPCQPVQSSEFLSGAVGSQNPFSIRFGTFAVGAAARAAGGMPEYGEYPLVPQPPAGLKTKKNPGVPPWAVRRLRDGHRLRCVGLTLWATTAPPPPFALHRWGGMTALHWAAFLGHLPAVRALVHAGAPLDIQTNDGRWAFCAVGSARGRIGGGSARAAASAAFACRKYTPLHMAAYNGHAGAMAALLGAGANASIKDIYG